MDCNPFKTRLLASSVFASAAFALGGVAIAQETPDDDVVETVTEVADSDAVQDTVVVTGSRIRRDSFSSTAPLQVIDGETIALTGQLNFSEALQSSPVVNGVQTTQSVSTQFVSDNGPGAQNIGLRGLGETRTLVLINSRRFAPAGIGGAPTAPDTGLIPSSMVERVDILLDGASSVYGSDAVSGVVNVILRDEFDGFSVGGQINMPQEDNGGSYSANFITGSSEGRTSFVFAGEYFKQEALNGCDRDWMRLNVDEEDWPDFAGQEICGSRDITEDGEFLGTGGQFQNFAAFPFGGIALGRPGTQDPFLGSVPNFESASLGANFNGLYRLSVPLNEDEQILNEFERSTFSFSSKTDLTDYIPDGEVFTEFNFAQRKTFFRGDYSIIDVVVTPDNPFLQEAGFLDPAGNPPPSNFTLRPASPTRNDQSTELNQYRFFTGLTGGLDFIGLDEWEFETFAGYTRSQGFSSQDAILEENLVNSLNTERNADGAIVCADSPNPSGPFSPGITREPCVPFNPFFPGLYPLNGEDPQFENELTENYLIGNRNITTFVDQKILGGFATGPVFTLPAGDLSAVVGFEWRDESIDTQSDDVVARGLADGFNSDRPTAGSVYLTEFFGEVYVPILKDQPFAEMLEVEGAVRFVDHEFYGNNDTYSLKGLYQPIESLSFTGTFGTSFRAPNLRELFLEGQSSFSTLTDPCEVPVLATIDTDGDGVLDTYDPGPIDPDTGRPQNDPRSQIVLDNCITEGVDPFSLAIGINTGSVETFSSGNVGLDPETSESTTYGVRFSQPWFDSFGLDLAVTAWEIEIEGAVFNPTAGFLVGECYSSTDFLNDPFCTRRLRNPATGFLQEIDTTPFNIAQETAKGVDYNARFTTDFTALQQDFSVVSDLLATYQDELSETIILEGADAVITDEAGSIGTPHWQAQLNTSLQWGDFTAFWQLRYIEGQTTDDNEDDDRSAGCFDLDRVDANMDPDPLDNPVCYSTEDTFYSDLSLAWQPDDLTVRIGVRNLFDQDPETVDEDVTFAGGALTDDARNVPLGAGYDRIGRTFFINLEKTF